MWSSSAETNGIQRIKPSNNFIDNLPDSWLDEDAIFNGNLVSKVTLDLNDPCLLVDIRHPNELLRTRRIGGDFKRRANKDLTQRYNISNDEAYDLMAKGISQNQVRGAIGHLEIEHSMPALRHQSPYVSIIFPPTKYSNAKYYSTRKNFQSRRLENIVAAQ